MEHLASILILGLLTYLSRLGGFAMDSKRMPRRIAQMLPYVPTAVFAVIIMLDLHTSETPNFPRLGGILVAISTFLWTRKAWVALAGGMAMMWVLQFVLR